MRAPVSGSCFHGSGLSGLPQASPQAHWSDLTPRRLPRCCADPYLPPAAAALAPPPKVDRKEGDVLPVLVAGMLGLFCVAHPTCRAYLQRMVAAWGLV